jgi:hypothetical protein
MQMFSRLVQRSGDRAPLTSGTEAPMVDEDAFAHTHSDAVAHASKPTPSAICYLDAARVHFPPLGEQQFWKNLQLMLFVLLFSINHAKPLYYFNK